MASQEQSFANFDRQSFHALHVVQDQLISNLLPLVTTAPTSALSTMYLTLGKHPGIKVHQWS
jgi:hypothetical protein